MAEYKINLIQPIPPIYPLRRTNDNSNKPQYNESRRFRRISVISREEPAVQVHVKQGGLDILI